MTAINRAKYLVSKRQWAALITMARGIKAGREGFLTESRCIAASSRGIFYALETSLFLSLSPISRERDGASRSDNNDTFADEIRFECVKSESEKSQADRQAGRQARARLSIRAVMHRELIRLAFSPLKHASLGNNTDVELTVWKLYCGMSWTS